MSGPRIDRERARGILARCRVAVGANFHALTSGQVESLQSEARAYGYRAPRNRNGSAARYWHEYLQRAAERPAD